MYIKYKIGSKLIEIVFTGNEDPHELADLLENVRSNELSRLLKTRPDSFIIKYQTGFSDSQLRRLSKRGIVVNPYKFVSTLPKKIGPPSRVDPSPVKRTSKNLMEYVSDFTLTEIDLFEQGSEESLFSPYDLNETGSIRIKKMYIQFLHESKQQKKL